jgi:RNA polymerase sigma-70 factor, ECF subfamily
VTLSPDVQHAHRAAERAARESYGRLLAFVARRCGDLVAAEEALAAAFAAAIETWPRNGVPAVPESWLLTVARRKIVDAARRDQVRARPDVLAALAPSEEPVVVRPLTVDERLPMMFACAHPAIDEAVRPALILQTVLGLEVKAMASAFLLSADTLTKRLTRAKRKIRLAGIRLEAPAPAELPERLRALLEAIYAAYFLGKEAALAEGDSHDELRGEAFYLAGLVAEALPQDPEALGFFALLHFVEARRHAQVDAAGAFVPLLDQHPGAWDHDLMRRGYQLLGRASAHQSSGPFQLEAAIQAAHCYRAHTGAVPWDDIVALYQALVASYPTIGAEVGLAVAVAHADADPSGGLARLRALGSERVEGYQPWWVAAAHLHALAAQPDEARRCLGRALELTSHPRLRAFLRGRLAALAG